MDPFEKRGIGSTGVEVTALGLGGAPISGMRYGGGLYAGTSYDEGVRIVKRAYELGVRYFDTAPFYGEGRSEARYGAVLPGSPRDGFALSTKASRVLDPANPADLTPTGPEGLPSLTPSFDMSRDGIRRSLDDSLARLKLDRVDILLLHDPDMADMEAEAVATAIPALIELRDEGVVRAIGCGINEWQMPARFIRRFDLDVVLLAGRYTLLDLSALAEFMPLCEERGVSVVIGGPYNSGILARDLDGPVSFDYKKAPPERMERAKALKAVCDRNGLSLKAAALQFVLAHPAVAAVIPGAASVSEIEENAQLIAERTPADLWTELKSAGLLPQEAPTPPLMAAQAAR